MQPEQSASQKISTVRRHGNISLTMATEGQGLYSMTWRNMMTGIGTSVTKLGGSTFIVGRQVADLDVPLTGHAIDSGRQAFRYFFINIDVQGNTPDHVRDACEDAARFVRRMEPEVDAIKMDKSDVAMRHHLGRRVRIGTHIESAKEGRLLDILTHKQRVLVQIQDGDTVTVLEIPPTQVWLGED